MRKRFNFFLLILLISNSLSKGKDSNKTALISRNNNKQPNDQNKSYIERSKRSLDYEDERPFWANRGKKQSEENEYGDSRYENHLESNNRLNEPKHKIRDEPPFWGNRGRRDSSSVENSIEDSSTVKSASAKNCKYCDDILYKLMLQNKITRLHERSEEESPFWGSRGRRFSNEDIEDDPESPFWGNRGRRQEDEPFWGNRGRRQDDKPFWGSRGTRQEDEPFWGSRGRRHANPWGSYARRADFLPFWGNRGRREEITPLWGNKGRREELYSWDNQSHKKQTMKDSIFEALHKVEEEIDTLARIRRESNEKYNRPLWNNRGRESSLKFLFNGTPRYKQNYEVTSHINPFNEVLPNVNTMYDDSIYAEQPHFILVERSSRSSVEDDPFFISRGKKKIYGLEVAEAARGRRGAIEDIVKSVKNDPYFIARGKKDYGESPNQAENFTASDNTTKARDLICATIDLIQDKNYNPKNKRAASENYRDRRTMLKDLAAQLQVDPYFVSRGKKSDGFNDKVQFSENFLNQVKAMCN